MLTSGKIVIASNNPKIQAILNEAITPGLRDEALLMCQHGCNDNYYLVTPLGKWVGIKSPPSMVEPGIVNRLLYSMGRQPGADEDFIIWTAKGGIIVPQETKTLQIFYGSQRQSWPYQSYVNWTPVEKLTTLPVPNEFIPILLPESEVPIPDEFVPYVGTETTGQTPNELILYLGSEAEPKD